MNGDQTGRCADCKWWGSVSTVHPDFRNCGAIGDNDSELAIIAPDPQAANLQTRATFFCGMWEPKR